MWESKANGLRYMIARRRRKSLSVKMELSSHGGQYDPDSEEGFEENSSTEVIHSMFKLLLDAIGMIREKKE